MFIAGSYADWSNNEPDGEICGVIDEEIQNKRLYADEHCNSQFAFICQIGMMLLSSYEIEMSNYSEMSRILKISNNLGELLSIYNKIY